MKIMSPVCAVAAIAMLGAMAGGAEAKTKVSKQEFGKTKDGHAVQIYTLTGAKGLEARIMTYGGIIVSLKTPDKHGKLGDIVLGFDSVAGYQQDPPPPYFGALIGRYGNRIAKGTFQLEGKKYNVPVNNELRPVAGTPFDFRTPFPIGARIDAHDEQIKLGGGYDHNHVLNKAASGLTKAATVTEPKSGRVMEVSTDQPGLQFYTGNFLDGSLTGKGGKTYARRSGFCLETQHFPDSPNHASFPSTELKPGQTYHTVTVFKFSAK